MACVAEGAHLAVINSDAEAEAVKAVFAKFPHHLIPTVAPFGKVRFNVYQGRGSRHPSGRVASFR